MQHSAYSILKKRSATGPLFLSLASYLDTEMEVSSAEGAFISNLPVELIDSSNPVLKSAHEVQAPVVGSVGSFAI